MNAVHPHFAGILDSICPPKGCAERSMDRITAERDALQRIVDRLLTVEVELCDGLVNSPDAHVTYVTVPQDITERCLLRLIESRRDEFEEMCEAEYRVQLGSDE